MPLLVVDDLFPYSVSGFRKAEFEWLLKHFADSRILTTLESLDWLDHDTSRTLVQKAYSVENPKLAKRTIFTNSESLEFDATKIVNVPVSQTPPSLVYCLFLNNAMRVADLSEKLHLPFVFTLYPGGGFHLGDAESDKKLLRVLSSPMLKGVIATMPVTREYLRRFLERHRIPDINISYIYGGILGSSLEITAPPQRPPKTPFSRHRIRVLFVAHRYSPGGRDKGLDLFLASCSFLMSLGFDIRPIIVGPWREVELTGLAHAQRFELLGLISNSTLHKLLETVSIAVFPTRASILGRGSFDGFPVGSAVEAAMHGVAVVTTNPLGMKTPLKSGRDYMRIRPNLLSIILTLIRLVLSPKLLHKVRTRGQKTFRQIFDLGEQMLPRIELLRHNL
jgi:glycosyltransferase involved in cell wall biosynthesis